MLMYIHIHNKYYFVISGSAPITGRMAIVTVNSLHCGVTYNITAGGMHNNGTPVGPGSSYKNITTGACPLEASEATYMHGNIYIHMHNCAYIEYSIVFLIVRFDKKSWLPKTKPVDNLQQSLFQKI